MPQLTAVCLDCGKVEIRDCPPEKAGHTVRGLCDDCYQGLLKQDPQVARWAFKGNDQAESKK